MKADLKRDEHTQRRIETLVLNKDFHADVRQLRALALIPEEGFDSFDEYFEYLRDEVENRKGNFIGMYFTLAEYTRKYNLPLNFIYWIEALVALGRNYKEIRNERPGGFQTEFDILGLNEALRIGDDRIEMYIFPGASQRSVIDFIKSNWEEIESSLNASGEKYGKPHLPRNRKRRNHSEIYQLYKKGLVDSVGIWKGDFEKRPDSIVGLWPDRIKQIIQQEARKEKFR